MRELVRRLDADGPAPADLDPVVERFFDALADDFNTPAARAALFDWMGEANRRLDAGEPLGPGRLPEMLESFGLERLLAAEEEAPDEIRELAARREQARADRDFAAADNLRDELAARGWEISGHPRRRPARPRRLIAP